MQDIAQVFDDLAPVNGQPMTTSRKVAARFKKQHKNVLQSIKRIEAQQPEFSRLNFQPVEYADSKGEMRPEYLMTRDGFSLLAMGFTGDAAMGWKVAYIEAFNAMAEEIARAARVPAIPLTLHEQALKLHAEAKTSEALGSIHGRGLRKRRDDKPVFVQQIAAMERALQLCLAHGLDRDAQLGGCPLDCACPGHAIWHVVAQHSRTHLFTADDHHASLPSSVLTRSLARAVMSASHQPMDSSHAATTE